MRENLNNREFFSRDAREVAENLLGMFICKKLEDGTVRRWCITETEAYNYSEKVTYKSDLFCNTGTWCIYYGMLMISCTQKNKCDNVLIRALDCVKGPSKLVELLKIKEIKDDINTQDVLKCSLLWVEDWGVDVISTKTQRQRLVNKAGNKTEIEAPKNYQAETLLLPFFN